MLGTCIDRVREQVPQIHNITNFVTVNDVANMVLACGGRPIMSNAPEDIAEITASCDGLNMNMGTLNPRNVEAMLIAGKKSNELGHPVLLDPVGVGASQFRISSGMRLMDEVKIDIVRGNISEIKTLALGAKSTSGVDADVADAVTEENLERMILFAKEFAMRSGSVVAITGNIDLVSDGTECYVIRNGRPEMRKITGTGCQLSGMMTAFLVANKNHKLQAAAAAVCAMGVAGEIAWEHMQEGDGNATYRNRIIDAVFHMDGKTLEARASYEVK